MDHTEKFSRTELFYTPSQPDLLNIAGNGAVLAMSSIKAAYAQPPGPVGSPSFAPTLPAHVSGATAFTEVFGDRQKMTGAAIGFDAAIDSISLSPSSFAVHWCEITRTCLNVEATSSQDTNKLHLLLQRPGPSTRIHYQVVRREFESIR